MIRRQRLTRESALESGSQIRKQVFRWPRFLAFINGLFGPEGMILIVLALLLFYGRNLPSVGRSLGKGINEFKKGLKGLEDDVDGSTGPNESV